MEAIRHAYGCKLAELGEAYPKLVVLDADVANSTCSIEFGRKYPQRFFDMGIAEANMVSMAAGLAAAGFLPVINTFSFLLCERALDQIRSGVAYNHLNVKLAANYGGLSDSFDGASHHTLTDLAVIRSIPGMTLVVLSDAAQTRSALPVILDFDGPVYFRLCRAQTPVIHTEGEPFEIGKGVVLADGTDVTIVVTGILTAKALEARSILRKDHISARVVEIHTLKPIDETLLEESARKTGCVLTCEEANILGGLGGAVAETLARRYPVPMDFVGVRDCYTQSGEYEELLEYYGMGAEEIASRAKRLAEVKQNRN